MAFYDLTFDRVGRVETCDADSARLFAAIGQADFPTPDLMTQRHNRSRPSDFTVAPAQRARSAAINAADHQAFGY